MRVGIQTWGSEGDIRPLLALGAGLSAAGHQVNAVVTDLGPRRYDAVGERHGIGIAHVATPVVDDPSELDRIGAACLEAASPVAQARIVIERLFLPAVDAMSAAGQDLVARSDLLVAHFFHYPARAAAERGGVPVCSVRLAHDFIPSAHRSPLGLPNLGRWINPLSWRLARAVLNRTLLGPANALRGEAGLPPARQAEGRATTARTACAPRPGTCPAPR